jgi:hypothetical protein
MTADTRSNRLTILEKKLEDAQAGIRIADCWASFDIVDEEIDLMLKVGKHGELRVEDLSMERLHGRFA